ncbi:MAG: transcriptional repressor [Gammaproteobacteria bacterium]|jgi:Fur family iron response transcriptional regulator|nr:transcriptional repressor [Gammaproteobacteria bacterium]
MIQEYIHFPLERNAVTALLRQRNITPTRQRLEIAHFLFQKQQHLSAEHILDNVNALGSTVSRATVYNTMALFARKGLIREVLVDRERIFYDTNTRPHHHIYNMDTGELSDVDADANIDETGTLSLPEGFHVVETEVVIKVSQK